MFLRSKIEGGVGGGAAKKSSPFYACGAMRLYLDLA